MLASDTIPTADVIAGFASRTSARSLKPVARKLVRASSLTEISLTILVVLRVHLSAANLQEQSISIGTTEVVGTRLTNFASKEDSTNGLADRNRRRVMSIVVIGGAEPLRREFASKLVGNVTTGSRGAPSLH
jgi:hypothetical protein